MGNALSANDFRLHQQSPVGEGCRDTGFPY